MKCLKSAKFYLLACLVVLAIGGIASAQTSIGPAVVKACFCSIISPTCSASPANCNLSCSVCTSSTGSVTCQAFQCRAYCTAFNASGAITCSKAVACPAPCP